MNYPENKKEISPAESAKEIEFAENFGNAAREMYSTENPNPGRVGCFTNETIRQMANSVNLPGDSVMNHLFDCSECFRDYRQALMLAKQTIEEENIFGWWNPFKLSPAKTALAGLGLVLLIGLTTLFSFWIFREKPSTELAQKTEVSNEFPTFSDSGIPRDSDKTINNQAAKNDTTERTSSPENQANLTSQTQSNKPEINREDNNSPVKKRREPEKNKSEKTNVDSLNLVLSASNVLRNTTGSNEKSVESNELVLPARKVNLNIKLPNNFSNGLYKFRIVDAFGNDLLEQKRLVKNRKLLLTNLNLQNLENRANKLCLQKQDETPDCFDIKIAR